LLKPLAHAFDFLRLVDEPRRDRFDALSVAVEQ
jgi:hypothetical protein